MELDINELLNFSPLMKTFTFNAWVVAGFTPITRGSTLDYYINRPQGMKGYIINLTLRGQARAKAGDGFLLCRENDLLLFPPGVPHHYGRDEHSASTAPGGLFRALRSHLTKLLYRWATAIRSISPACFVNITASHRANIANAMRK